MEAFAAEFEVDLTGLEFHRHFQPVRPALFCSRELKEEMKDLGKYPVTIGHLIDVASAKRWNLASSPRLEAVAAIVRGYLEPKLDGIPELRRVCLIIRTTELQGSNWYFLGGLDIHLVAPKPYGEQLIFWVMKTW